MMELYCAFSSRDSGKPTQLAGAGIVLIYTDTNGRSSKRSFGWNLGSSSSGLAEIQSARLALCSVLPQFRGYVTKIYTTKRVIKILKGETDPKNNQREVAELRKWYGFYKEIDAIPLSEVSSEDVSEARELAKKSLDEQQHFDSGTVVLE
jgi:hypothetical protein